MSRNTVADVLVDALERAGTARLFVAGGAGRGVVETARRRGLDAVPASSATAACVMAAVTGDLTAVPGVAVAALGPEVVRGAARALVDRSPMLVLTDGGDGRELGAGGLQGLGEGTALARVTKGRVALDAASAGHGIAHALQLAMREPRGPVQVALARDVLAEPALPVATSGRPSPPSAPDARALAEAARLLSAAARPVLVAGLECRSHEISRWLRALAEALPAPVLVTRKAKGVVPDPHPLVLGGVGGDQPDHPLLGAADLIVAIGVDTAEILTSSWPSAIPRLRLAASPAAGEGARTDAEVVGDIALIIEELAPRLRERERADWDVALLDRIKRGLAAERPRAAGSHRPDATRRARGNALLAPARAVQIARELTPAGTPAIADAGARAMVAASWAAVAPNEFVCSDDPGRGGFGLPAAIAAQLVHPGRRAVCFTAAAPLLDASAELATACRLGLPIIVVVLDDDSGDAREGDAPATVSTDVVGLAASSGVVALAAAGEEAFRQAFHRAYTSHGPCLLDARSG